MRNIYWIPIGLVAGALAGAPYGMDYSVAGAGIGAAGGFGILLGLRVREGRRTRRKSP